MLFENVGIVQWFKHFAFIHLSRFLAGGSSHPLLVLEFDLVFVGSLLYDPTLAASKKKKEKREKSPISICIKTKKKFSFPSGLLYVREISK